MRNLIFAPETINIAETTRMIEVAKHCTGFFNPIFFGYSDKFSYLIERVGFEFRKMEPWLTEEEIEHLWKVDRMEKWADPFSECHLAKRVENEIALFNEISPAAVVTGFTLSTTISTRAAKIPFVYIMPFSYTRPFFESKIAEIPEMAENLLKLVPNKWSKSVTIHSQCHFE
jgi:UDP:flavonoid glycosyltransferase YjiC (YdhE family)